MKEKFKSDYEASKIKFNTIKKMVVAVKLPTGATELIINTENIDSKYEYYLNAYDDEMRLKANTNVFLAGWLFV